MSDSQKQRSGHAVTVAQAWSTQESPRLLDLRSSADTRQPLEALRLPGIVQADGVSVISTVMIENCRRDIPIGPPHFAG